MTSLELCDDVSQRQLAHRQQQQQVINEIRSFRCHARAILRRRREGQLDTFLAELLCDLENALRRKPVIEERGKISALVPVDERCIRGIRWRRTRSNSRRCIWRRWTTARSTNARPWACGR